MAEQAEEQKKFAKGEVLFQQGDPGGDLFFILDGEVTIFTDYQGSEVILSTMTKGEVIGTMTCLTKANRMASARALTDVIVKYISHENLSKAIKAMPKWMNVVLKDVSLRLSIMNENFSQAKAQLRKIEGEQLNALYIAGQMARIIAAVAPDKQKSFDDIPGLLPADILDYIEPMMGRSRLEIEEIFEIFQNCGIIDMKIEKEKKRKYFTVKNAQALRDFSEFLEQAKRRKIKNILDAKFTGKENRRAHSLMRGFELKSRMVGTRGVSPATRGCQVSSTLESLPDSTSRIPSSESRMRRSLFSLYQVPLVEQRSMP